MSKKYDDEGFDYPIPPHHRTRSQFPFPSEEDEEYFTHLLDGDEATARMLMRLCKNCPPEIAAVACMIARLDNRIARLEELLKRIFKEE